MPLKAVQAPSKLKKKLVSVPRFLGEHKDSESFFYKNSHFRYSSDL
jgi:hypothetical protein